MKIFFLIVLILLAISHLIFTFRPLIYKRNFRAGLVDKIARNMAHILLPIVSIIGIFVIDKIYLITLLWLPISLILISHFFRNWFKKRYYLLPLTNSIVLTGVLILCL